jgi:serine protease Do
MSIKYSRARLGAAVVVAFLCGLIFASGFNLTRFGWAQGRVTPASNRMSNAPMASAAETETAFEAVADHARPAVVSIQTETFARPQQQQQQRLRGRGGQQLPPGIEDFFRQFNGPDAAPSDQPEEASGSGFIISPDGYILTNNHVVADADKVTVALFDKRQFQARVVGRDPTTDVAVVKIDATNLPTLSLGDDSKARVGQWVLAIGNPFDLDFTVTAGIVSAKGRTAQGLLNSKYALTDYIQTDAAINPGNSGGPLLDIQGDVIGINSAIESGTGSYAGYGFAIPINLAHEVMNDLIKYGKVRRGIVGVALNEVTAADAKAAGLSQIGGAKVSSFDPDPGSPAEAAGIKIADIIIAANGQPVDQVNTLQRIIRGFQPGQTVDLEVMRFGQKKDFKVKLGEAPSENPTVASAEAPAAPADNGEPATRSYDKLGITVAPVSADFAQQAHLSGANRSGLQITKVSPSGPSWESLFPQTDVIVAELYPTARDIHSMSDLQSAVAPLKAGDVVEFKIYDARQQGTRAVSVQIGK